MYFWEIKENFGFGYGKCKARTFEEACEKLGLNPNRSSVVRVSNA